jgi:hypothetical protein
VRVLAFVIAVAALVAAGAAQGQSRATCPHTAGSVTYVRAGKQHTVSLATCADRVTGKAKPVTGHRSLRSAQGRVATIRVTKTVHGLGAQTIVVDGKPVLRVGEDYRKIPGGAPGPLGLVAWSPDGSWLFYFVDPMSSASLAADGLVLRALDVADGRTVEVTRMLIDGDYLSWCGSTLVLTANGDRLAAHHKRLAAAHAPGWRLQRLWNDPKRAFGSVACAPDGKSVAVLSQHDIGSDDSFFATSWQLWRVGLDGSHTLLDRPPAGWADESPTWSPDGSAIAFVRERKGRGLLAVLTGGKVFEPLANLGYSLGYYGHHLWPIAWRR